MTAGRALIDKCNNTFAEENRLVPILIRSKQKFLGLRLAFMNV